MHRRFIIVTMLILFTSTLGLSTSISISQEITPTPAPSKTPSSTDDIENPEVTPEATEELVATTTNIEPFTQSDLNVLIGNVQRPNGAVWYNDLLYVACSGDSTLYEIHDTTGSTRTYIFGVRNAHSMYLEEISETSIALWVPDYDANALLRVNQTGSPQQISTELDNPWGIDFVDDEHFIVTNLGNDTISLVNRDGRTRTIIEELRSPTGIAVQSDYIYFANNGSARRSIEWINTADALDEEASPTPETLVTGLQNTTGIVLADDGFLYFTYALGTRGVVGRVNPEVCLDNGGCSNDQVEIVLYTELAAPLAGLTITPDMRLFVHTIYRPEIYWLQLDSIERQE